MSIQSENQKSPKKYPVKVHPHNPRLQTSTSRQLGEDAVADAQGYGSRPSNSDFEEETSQSLEFKLFQIESEAGQRNQGALHRPKDSSARRRSKVGG